MSTDRDPAWTVDAARLRHERRRRGQSVQEDEATSVDSPAPPGRPAPITQAPTRASSASPQGARIITIEWPQPQDDEASTAAAPASSSASALPSAEDRSPGRTATSAIPALDDGGSQELLAELDAAPPSNAEQQLGWVMVLERRLLEGQGRCPLAADAAAGPLRAAPALEPRAGGGSARRRSTTCECRQCRRRRHPSSGIVPGQPAPARAASNSPGTIGSASTGTRLRPGRTWPRCCRWPTALEASICPPSSNC